MHESRIDEAELNGFHPPFNRPTKFRLIRGKVKDWHPFFLYESRRNNH